jgi:hypothetical protein
MKNKRWIIATLILAIICSVTTHSLATKNHEADIEQVWLNGYQAYQEDTYLPKPDHKAPDSRLKGKVSG